MKTQQKNIEDFAELISNDEILSNEQMNHLRGGDEVEDPKTYIKK